MTSSSQPRALVIGFGSIGVQHANVLEKLGFSVAIVSRRARVSAGFANFRSIADAVDTVSPSYAVVATETAAHSENLKALGDAGFFGTVLVEKPIFDRPQNVVSDSGSSIVPSHIYVGYQLRFDPIAIRLREMTGIGRSVTAEFHVGQHLDRWRPGRGARDFSTGHAAMGGGVLRDLSHELDLAQFLFGRCQRVAALGGRLSEVTSDSDDAWGIVAQFERCPIVTFQLNYLDPTKRRHVVVVAEGASICADFVARSVTFDGTSVLLPIERYALFESMHRSILEQRGRDVCDFASGLHVVEMVDAIERAARTRAWVEP